MNVLDNHSKMPRLFIIFRTFDRIWDCAMLTREFSPVEMDTSTSGIHLMFQTDLIANNIPQSRIASARDTSVQSRHFYTKSHQKHLPIFFGKQTVSLWRTSSKHVCCQPAHMHSENLQTNNSFINRYSSDNHSKSVDMVSYFVLPTNKCTIIVDAHMASCINSEINRSRTFRKRFFNKIRNTSGFRDCTPDYESWTEDERDAHDNYLSLPFMLDVVAVWPWQIVDHGWSDRILSLVNKYVMLEESLAWLSTLGGAHSSLGETFIAHAEKAGEISMHQLRLAKELGNEIMIARCYLYWAWSLLQRDYLAKCKVCILHTWKYVKKVKCSDKVLTNMCKAVWSRLQYKRSLAHEAKVRCCPGAKDSEYGDTDGSGCVAQRNGAELHYGKAFKRSRLQLQPVEVC